MKPNAPEGEELLKKIGLDRTTENVIDLRIWGLGVRIPPGAAANPTAYARQI